MPDSDNWTQQQKGLLTKDPFRTSDLRLFKKELKSMTLDHVNLHKDLDIPELMPLNIK